MVAQNDNLKWKRLGKGKYTAVTNCGRVVFIERGYGNWSVYLDGGYAVISPQNTFRDAKFCVPQLMPVLIERFEQRQAKESAERLIESEKIRALSAPVYDPTAGVSWFDWAECFVGCTAAAVRRMDTGRNKRWKKFLQTRPLTYKRDLCYNDGSPQGEPHGRTIDTIRH